MIDRPKAIVIAAFILSVLANIALAQDPTSSGYEELRWTRKPIDIKLSVGKERFVVFPGAVMPGIPPALSKRLAATAVGDTIYFTARDEISVKARIPVRSLEGDDTLYLIDISTTGDAPSVPARIAEGRPDVLARIEPPTEAQERDDEEEQYDHGYLALSRFAAQSLYAPERLIDPLPGLVPVDILADQPTEKLIRGRHIWAQAVMSWRAKNGLYVTAVHIRNRLSEPVPIDPRLLRGSWMAATRQHATLGPINTSSDTSALYLISNRPFEAVAGPYLQGAVEPKAERP